MKPTLLRASFALLLAFTAAPLPAAEKPNIIVILVDDMGFSDIGCYGGEIPTPNLDKLAANGLRFTQFYNTGRCCPTRASLLTGLYSHQAGVGGMVQDQHLPGYRGHLNDRCVTLGDVLRRAGYLTAASGKWHVGHTDKSMWPLQRGFDRFFGMPEGGGFYFKVRPERTVALGNDVVFSPTKQPPAGWYTTDAIHEHGVGFIDEALAAKKPFFLYLAHNAPHFPLQAPAEEIAKFRGKYRAGWDALRTERHRREVELGIVKPASPLSPRPAQVAAWEERSEAERDADDERMAIYAAMIWHLDRRIGDLTAHLKERGVLDDTLILFLSDNGGTAEGGTYGTMKGSAPGSADSHVLAGQAWATLQNTPFRRYKSENHEGGIATPLIAHWPAGIAARGEWSTQVGHVMDIMPTVVELSGARYPSEAGGKPVEPMEGRSLVKAFHGETGVRGPLFWEHQGAAAVRDGDLKLVRLGRQGPWELYDLKTDRTELHDLAAAQPEKAKELADKWEAWAERAQVKPYPGGMGNAAAKTGNEKPAEAILSND